MFEEIHDNSIWVWIKRPESAVFSIPNSSADLVVHRLQKMLDWLYAEFIEDARTHKQLFDEAFQIRNISRTLSYVNHLYIIEGILKRMYQDMITELKKYGVSISTDIAALNNRKSEIASAVEFRHTVAAHTAYARPHKKKDDDITPFRSLDSFLMTGFDGKDTASFMVNAGERATFDGRFSKRKIPPIELRDLHKKVKDHFKAWITMFIENLILVHEQLPKKTDNYELTKATDIKKTLPK